MNRARVAVLLVAFALTGCSPAPAAADPTDFMEIPGIGSTRIDVPRATSSQASTCTADGLPTPSDQSVEERVSALRAFGFFGNRADATDDEVATEVAASIKSDWGEQIGPADPLFDLFVAEQDRDRIWWRDLEADVSDGNLVYQMTVAELGGISVGSFRPSAITERWDSDTGPVTVTFELDGTEHVLQPSYLEDWIDLGILTGINELIAPSGRRFESYRAFDQTALVVSLTADERLELERDRGWCFE